MVKNIAGDAVEERLEGGRPSWLKALLAAAAIGIAAAVISFRLLRSSSPGEHSGD
jgi:hypothetical protein